MKSKNTNFKKEEICICKEGPCECKTLLKEIENEN